MSGDREKVVAAGLKTYFYEAYDAGRRAGLEEAAQLAQFLWNATDCTDGECAEISTAIRSLADGWQK